MNVWDKRRRNLKAIIAVQGTNPTRVADAAKLSVNTLSKFLRGETKHMRSNSLEAVCKALGISNIAVLDADNPFSNTKNKLYELIEHMSEEEAAEHLKHIQESKTS